MSMATMICLLAVTAMRRRPSPKVSGFPVRSAAGFVPNPADYEQLLAG
jgi:hypothetical protein